MPYNEEMIKTVTFSTSDWKTGMVEGCPDCGEPLITRDKNAGLADVLIPWKVTFCDACGFTITECDHGRHIFRKPPLPPEKLENPIPIEDIKF
eukprot:g19274.t1